MVTPAEGGAEQSPRSCGAGEEPGRAHDHGLWSGEEPAATQYPLHRSALVGPQGTDCTRGTDKGGWASAATKRRIASAEEQPSEEQPSQRQPSVDSATTLQSCPMCQVDFAPGLAQLDVDSHLAQCLADSTDDIEW
ncbi:FAAP20 [Cervus elaphus hippelaphus]|uniref:FAAP20 n=1 Tax=Cervus elaphus hippelaphus TaxID=46360 RepID=A0A212CR19_CEREH|nr:FAAP20 [Cervus elaphus hippelaphus]